MRPSPSRAVRMLGHKKHNIWIQFDYLRRHSSAVAHNATSFSRMFATNEWVKMANPCVLDLTTMLRLCPAKDPENNRFPVSRKNSIECCICDYKQGVDLMQRIAISGETWTLFGNMWICLFEATVNVHKSTCCKSVTLYLKCMTPNFMSARNVSHRESRGNTFPWKVR